MKNIFDKRYKKYDAWYEENKLAYHAAGVGKPVFKDISSCNRESY